LIGEINFGKVYEKYVRRLMDPPLRYDNGAKRFQPLDGEVDLRLSPLQWEDYLRYKAGGFSFSFSSLLWWSILGVGLLKLVKKRISWKVLRLEKIKVMKL